MDFYINKKTKEVKSMENNETDDFSDWELLSRYIERLEGVKNYYEECSDKLMEMFLKVSNDFDGYDYSQGRKDGIRNALTIFGNTDWNRFNRDGGSANPYSGHNEEKLRKTILKIKRYILAGIQKTKILKEIESLEEDFRKEF
jgi:hypothetical protein